jgi:hypothetical protein
MTYESFLKVLLSLQKQDRVISKAYEMKIDIIDFVDPYHAIISVLIKEIYGEVGYEWFSWYCYDSEFGQRDWSTQASYKQKGDNTIEIEHEVGEVRFGAYDEHGNPICYSHESLWEYLEENHKI